MTSRVPCRYSECPELEAARRLSKSSPKSPRSGFTLIELLVVMAIIGVLVSLLLPAIMNAREASRRVSCTNNLKQLGLAMHNFHDVNSVFPPGYEQKQTVKYPALAPTLYRWSFIARILPYVEQENLRNIIDLETPLLLSTAGNVTPENVEGVKMKLALLICPSDSGKQIIEGWAPSNYVGCIGSGALGGIRLNSDGILYTNAAVKFRDITDGTTQTAMISESTIGPGGANLVGLSGQSPREVWGSVGGQTDMTEPVCQAVTNFRLDRNSKWADGEAMYSLYDHARTPNSPFWDCGSVGRNWKAARSRHPGGVNLLLCDGSVRYVGDHVDSTIWKSVATRSQNDLTSGF